MWSVEATETLGGCFHSTDWDVLLTGASLEEQVEVITYEQRMFISAWTC